MEEAIASSIIFFSLTSKAVGNNVVFTHYLRTIHALFTHNRRTFPIPCLSLSLIILLIILLIPISRSVLSGGLLSHDSCYRFSISHPKLFF